jgi:hypothetical protein
MPAVTLNPGKYWIGNPSTVVSKWESNPQCTYKCGEYTFHAFKFGKNYVAAIPLDAILSINPDFKANEIINISVPTMFYEQNGDGVLCGIQLGTIGKTVAPNPLAELETAVHDLKKKAAKPSEV